MRLLQEKGNANAVWWARRCLAVLGAGWDKVGLRQLSGMLVLIFARQVWILSKPTITASLAVVLSLVASPLQHLLGVLLQRESI